MLIAFVSSLTLTKRDYCGTTEKRCRSLERILTTGMTHEALVKSPSSRKKANGVAAANNPNVLFDHRIVALSIDVSL